MKTLPTIAAVILLITGMVLTQTKDEKEVTVGIGASKTIADTPLEVKFAELLEDSRCPEGANCIWAGTARVRIEIKGDNKAMGLFELETNGPTTHIDVDRYRITLKAVDPYPHAHKPTDRATYKATFVISDLK
jgi:hypothetical protein